ncbi:MULTISPECIES: S9 family peptidase [Pseudothermotoga]|uniref:S9 family peptidase n=1 Tax=Pseudothermotoga TaxID=1643951 RepID=UPI00048DCAB6|nr:MULTISPECIES: S9 family peptidase [Pseudothermotoga]
MIALKWECSTFTKFVVPVEVKISRDGRWIAYTLKKISPAENKTIRQITIKNLSTGESFYLPQETSKPKFSPDGKKLAFIRKINDSNILSMIELAHFSEKEILKVDSLTAIDWSSDSKKLLIMFAKKRNDKDLYFEDTLPVWFDGKGFLDSSIDVVQIIDVESCQVLDQMEERNIANIFWIENDIVYAKYSEKKPFTEFDIFLYTDGKKRLILEKVGLIPTSAEGKKIIMLGRERKSAFQHEYVYLYENGKLHPLTEKYALNNSGHISAEIWASDSEVYPLIRNNTVYFKSGSGGKILLEKLNLEETEKQTIISDNSIITAFDASDNGRIVFVKVSPEKPAEVYLYENGKENKVTELNQSIISKLKVRPMKHLDVTSFDGTNIDAWYIKPDSVPAPAVVFVHGGPKGAYGYNLYFLGQLLAEEGFFVLFTNPRGSDNYSEQFALTVTEKTGKEDFKDILAAIDNLRKNEQIASVGITGISYGGYMTNWAITQTDLFKAAVSENGISYWFTSYAFSDIGFWFDKSLIGNDPLSNPNYRELSPIFYVKNIKTPLLLIHSLEDFRCPLDQSLMFYTILKDFGKEVYLAIFKKGAHGHSVQGSYTHRLKRYKLIVEFFKQKLLEEKEGFDVNKCFE